MSNFIVTGRRCGTTALASALGQIDDVEVSLPKEPRIFENEDPPTLAEYHDLFGIYGPSTVLVSARSRMMTLPFALARAKDLIPDLKIIYLVKNPIMRAFSDWQFYKSTFPNTRIAGFFRIIDSNLTDFDLNCYSVDKKYMYSRRTTGPSPHRFLEDGMYTHHLKNAYEIFDRDEIFVIDLQTCETYQRNQMYDFLELGDVPMEVDKINKIKKDFEITPAILKELDENIYNKMHTLYKEDVMNLSVLTGINYLDRWGF